MSREWCEMCVFPVLLYSCENWVLNHQPIESFQAQLVKRIWRLAKATVNAVPLLALRCPSMRAKNQSHQLGFIPKPENESPQPHYGQWLLTMCVTFWQSSSVLSWRNPSKPYIPIKFFQQVFKVWTITRKNSWMHVDMEWCIGQRSCGYY